MNIKKTVLVYFSPTGGTERTARLLAERLGWETEELDICSGAEERVFKADELALIAVPVYGGRIPAPVHERLNNLRGEQCPALLLAVYGNRAVDDALAELQDAAEKRGFVTVAGAEFIAPHSVDPSFGSGRPDEKDMGLMDELAAALKKKLVEMPAPERIVLPGKRPYVKYGGIPMKPAGDKKKCVSCGRCVSHCPVGAISAETPWETDKNICISCMGCIAVCPHGARKLPELMKIGGHQMLKKICSDRKEPEYYI